MLLLGTGELVPEVALDLVPRDSRSRSSIILPEISWKILSNCSEYGVKYMYEVMSGDSICMDGIILPLGTIHMQHWHLHQSIFFYL